MAEAEGELDEMTKNRDELQAVVDELEEKVQQLDLERVSTLFTTMLQPEHACTPMLLTLNKGKLTSKICHGQWKKVNVTGPRKRLLSQR